MTWFFKHPRLSLFLIAIGCFASIAYALHLQHVLLQKPCPLCILQRYAFIFVGIFCLAGSFLGFKPGLWRAAASLGAVSGIAGIAVAAYHSYNYFQPPSEGCGADKIMDFVNAIPIAEWQPDLFFSMGSCTDKYPPILGLPIMVWTLVMFITLTIMLLAFALRTPFVKQRAMFAGMR
jgi:protein dithiol:quinone oxidoreductase